jgi:UDP-glucose:(heptosyl)LPS alpha-1,3-glucosyltransferase
VSTVALYTLWRFVYGARYRFDVINSTDAELLWQDVITAYGVHKRGIKRRQLEPSRRWRARARNLVKRLVRYTPMDLVVLGCEHFNLHHAGYSHIIAISPATRRELIEEYQVPPEDITVVPLGVDVEEFRPPSPARREAARSRYRVRDRLAIVTVATEFRRKGIRELIEAAAALVPEFPTLRVLVAGRDDPSELQALARRRGIEDHVQFVGRVPDVQEFLASGDLFALPTKYEGFGLTILEAMAVGLPVVVTRTGLGELLSHGTDGLVLQDADDVRELATHLHALLASVDLRQTLGRAARGFAERMTWRDCANATVAVYRRASAHRPRSADSVRAAGASGEQA